MDKPKQTTDALEHVKDLQEIRKRLVESIEYIDSIAEQERKKRENISPSFQE